VGNAGGSGGTPSAAGGSITAMGQSITASDDGGGNAEHLSGSSRPTPHRARRLGRPPGELLGPGPGVDTAASQDSGYEVTASQGYTIPIETALKLAKKIEDGDASSTVHIGATGFLGSAWPPVPPAPVVTEARIRPGRSRWQHRNRHVDPTTPGADVEGALSGSPAAKAGLVQGDVITAVNGSSITRRRT